MWPPRRTLTGRRCVLGGTADAHILYPLLSSVFSTISNLQSNIHKKNTTGSGCGSNPPTTTASSTPTVDVIKQIEEDCGIRSQRGETVFYEWWSYDRDDDTVQFLVNAMPEDVYEQYNEGKGASADAYLDDGDASYEDTVGSGDYRWTWHIYYFGSGSTELSMK